MSFDRFREALQATLRPGVAGDFDHVELLEILATPRGGQPHNVFSIAVLGEGRPEPDAKLAPEFLTGRVALRGVKDWTFGATRTLLPVSALDAALARYAAKSVWSLSGKPLGVGALQPQPPVFAPPDGTVSVPLNQVLKNNFWAGSHLFRLADLEKSSFGAFFAERRLLQDLSDEISKAIPLKLAGLADLLGDVLVQVPVTVVELSVGPSAAAEATAVAVTWRSTATARPLTVAGRSRSDGLLIGAAVSERFATTVDLPIDSHADQLETELWDAETGRLIGATASTGTVKTVSLNIHALLPEPRVFTGLDSQGQPRPERISLQFKTTSSVGDVDRRDSRFWLGRRQDLEEKRALQETRDFVQYRPDPGSSDERRRALEDIRFLIARHGAEGVDLWDPYLCAKDLLETLFHCPFMGAPLRALTDGRDPSRPKIPEDFVGPPLPPPPPFPVRQQMILQRDGGNLEGLHLEYRTRRGPKGWEFHDRFLIFPNRKEGPLAWSLGTSVNSLGMAHHILQLVSNPALVAGAFADLWTALDEPKHVVWRSW